MMERAFSLISLVLIGTGLISPTLDYTIFKKERLVSPYLTLGGLGFSGIILGVLAVWSYGRGSVSIYGGMLQIEPFGIFLSFVATIGAILLTVATLSEVKNWSTSPSLYSLVTLGVLGSYFLVSVGDLTLLIAAWALVSVISYVIVGLRKDRASVEAAGKYALMGVIASIFILYAVAMVYGMTGSTSLRSISDLATGEGALIIMSSVFFISAFGFKIGLVPFHGWLPDVYGKAHPILIVFLTSTATVAVVGLIVRVLFTLAPLITSYWPILIGLISVFTMTFGNVTALIQNNVQKMMAFSSIAQMGYIFAGMAAGPLVAGGLTLQGIALHLGSYSFAKAGVFVFLAYLLKKGLSLQISDLKGLGKSMPITATAFGIILLNLVGIPPLLGFWSKFYLFSAAAKITPWLTLIAIINSGISVGYYVRPIKSMFFEEGSDLSDERIGDFEQATVIAASFLLVSGGLVLPSLISILIP
ncbi:hypothetical protein AKJ61_02050 [candidate division MSBL1 archaeon SCGC-AAA259B11]|uniref:NADH:quinone oxidoreductase/Mrp antiporter transmembrane domain-containing protein n=1 Tax=candidate division MSBL1 archaeon SCGC-AAA259B11 TaxID=1698260 RepID=A0A133U6N4_9EURY|nr:hypothetical protein AKJ61_02050 [candidate division MSBL1 archaeon SCGC-AAA259B11]